MRLWYILPILLVAGCITDSAPLSGLVLAVQDPEPVQVSIGINDGKSIKVDMITVLQGTTALEAFQQIADVKTREVNYAKYVIGIGDVVENPRSNLFWVFYVDNEVSVYGSADYIITEPVNLEFRYEPMPEHQ